MITSQQFSSLYPNCVEPEEWVQQMENIFPEYGIDTNKRIALFIAQCGHESAGWRLFEENLNYSADRLNVIFPKYFKNAQRDAREYHRQPEKIANVVYANRMGNGGIESGDGWYFRGRGPIQLTGLNNYQDFSTYIGIDVQFNSSLVTKDKKIALLSAIWYWNKHNLNYYADKSDINECTKIINGGYNGLEDRIYHYNKVLEILQNPQNPQVSFEIIKIGSRGDAVVTIQKHLGLTYDGIFGRNTEEAVKIWQKNNNLIPDGIVGPKTFEKMLI